MSGGLPGIGSATRLTVRFLIDNSIACQPEAIVLDSGNVDSGSTPTSRFRAGNVVVYKTSIGQYVEANDTTGDRPTQPTVTSAEAADTDWDGTTITTYLDGVLVATSVLAGSDDSTSEVVTKLNTDYAAANLPIVASGLDAAVLVIKVNGGIHSSLRVESTLATAYATAGGAGSYAEDVGNEADYRVTLEDVDLIDRDGTAQDAQVAACKTGYFDESALINLTVAAKAELQRRGARFG